MFKRWLFRANRCPFAVRGLASATKPPKGAVKTTRRPAKLVDDNDFDFSSKKQAAVQTSEVDTRWLDQFRQKSKEPDSVRVKRFLDYFDRYDYDRIEKLSTDFVTLLRPRLIKFGDAMYKQVVTEDEQLKAVYKENPTYAYLMATAALLETSGSDAVEETRMDTPRKHTDERVYEYFQKCLDRCQRDNDGMEKLVDAYKQLPEPRSLHMSGEDLETFLNVMGRHIDELDVKVGSEIYEDVLASGMPLTSTELTLWISGVVACCEKFDEKMYKSLVAALGSVTQEQYNAFLKASLVAQDGKLFNEILDDMASSETVPDRHTLTLLEMYSAVVGDMNSWLNTMDLRLQEYPYALSVHDWEMTIASLVKLGQRQLAHNLLDILVAIRNGFKVRFEDDLAKDEDLAQILELDNSTQEYFPYRDPWKMFDAVADDQELVMMYPRLTTAMFRPFILTSPDPADLDVWLNAVHKLVAVKDLAHYRAMFYGLANQKELPLDVFERHLTTTLDEAPQAVIADEYNLRGLIGLVGSFVERGLIETEVLDEVTECLKGEADMSDEDVVKALKRLVSQTKLEQ